MLLLLQKQTSGEFTAISMGFECDVSYNFPKSSRFEHVPWVSCGSTTVSKETSPFSVVEVFILPWTQQQQQQQQQRQQQNIKISSI